MATAWNLWARWHLSDASYNTAWTVADLIQLWAEAGLLCELLWNVLRDLYTAVDGLLAFLLFVHLILATTEYHSWLAFLNDDGWQMHILRKQENIAVIVATILAVYIHRERHCAQE